MTVTILETKGVGIRFGGLQAVNDVSFAIRAGEIVGLIGPNGAGKTTLFNLLVGLRPPTSGEIFLNGKTITGLRPNRIARLGMTKTFQNTALFPDMTLLENVTTAALTREPLDRAKEIGFDCLKQVGLQDFADSSVQDLTFPQRALGEMARALATQPKIVLLDEVMAALTPAEMQSVMAVIRSLAAEGLTFIIVEHHMRAIMALCQRIFVLNFGQLIADGTPVAVAADPAVIRAYLGSEAEENLESGHVAH